MARDKSSFTLPCQFWIQNHSRTKLTKFAEVTLKFDCMKHYSDSWCSSFLYNNWVFLICQDLKGRLTVLSWLQSVLPKHSLLIRAELLICVFYSHSQVLHQSPLLYLWRWDEQLSCQGTLRWDRKKGKRGVAFFCSKLQNFGKQM